MKNFWRMAFLSIVLLNLLDAFLTLYGIRRGAQEVNPLMRYALENGIFLHVKVLVSLTLCLFYARVTNSLPIKIAIIIVLSLYCIMNASHIFVIKSL
jgi:hypothetical protein